MNESKTCPVCAQQFDPMWRIATDAELEEHQLAGVLAQVVYCSEKCRSKAANKRYYSRHKKRP